MSTDALRGHLITIREPRDHLTQRGELRGSGFFLLKISLQHHQSVAGGIVLRVGIADKADRAPFANIPVTINVVVIRHIRPGGLGLAAAKRAGILRKLLQ